MEKAVKARITKMSRAFDNVWGGVARRMCIGGKHVQRGSYEYLYLQQNPSTKKKEKKRKEKRTRIYMYVCRQMDWMEAWRLVMVIGD
jgi:hypothetical protein